MAKPPQANIPTAVTVAKINRNSAIVVAGITAILGAGATAAVSIYSAAGKCHIDKGLVSAASKSAGTFDKALAAYSNADSGLVSDQHFQLTPQMADMVVKTNEWAAALQGANAALNGNDLVLSIHLKDPASIGLNSETIATVDKTIAETLTPAFATKMQGLIPQMNQGTRAQKELNDLKVAITSLGDATDTMLAACGS